MKKLAKLAALLAAGALVFGFAACSDDGDDDDDDTPPVTATLTADGIELEATVTATLTLANDVFSEVVKNAGDLDGLIEADTGEKAEVISVTLEEQLTEANVARIAIKVAAAEGAVVGDSGTITVRVTGAALANTSETVTAEGGIAYTVKAVQTDSDFPTKMDSSMANNAATLGLVGTRATSSHPSVATAKIEGGKIVITSHGAGSATISVTVTTDGTITKYEPTPVIPPSDGELSYTLFKLDDLSSDDSLSNGELSDELTALGITLVGDKLSTAKVAAAENPSTSAFNGDALSLTNYVGTQGAINGSNYLKVVAIADMTVYVYARSSSTDGHFLALYSGTDNNGFDEDTKQGIGSNEGAVLEVAKFEIKKDETKYIGSTGSGINIYAIGVVTGGKPDEKTAQTVSATPATCTESGIKAHTITNLGRYQCGGSYVPYSSVTEAALGHDYANTTGTVSTMPTADAKGSYTATCKRDSQAETFELPALNSPKYERTASDNQTSYTYKDAETGCTVSFTAGTVEAD